MIDFHIDMHLGLLLFTGYIDHSSRVMRVITWNKLSNNIPNADGKDDFDKDECETHATVLEKLLAWEKKLYEEVKVCQTGSFGAICCSYFYTCFAFLKKKILLDISCLYL